jgi:hypothetical protein
MNDNLVAFSGNVGREVICHSLNLLGSWLRIFGIASSTTSSVVVVPERPPALDLDRSKARDAARRRTLMRGLTLTTGAYCG